MNESNGMIGEDDRVKRSPGRGRGSRSAEDNERVMEDGTALGLDERRKMLRAAWTQELLPHVQGDPNYHYIWLSTTNQNDPVYKRLQIGYELVKAGEVAALGVTQRVPSGEFEGCVSINEMILAKIHRELYQEIMLINHHEKPMEEEGYLKANALPDGEDSDGHRLGHFEGDGIRNLGRQVRRPSF